MIEWVVDVKTSGRYLGRKAFGVLSDLYYVPDGVPSIGEVYAGKVTRAVLGLGGYFVDLGQTQGFLPASSVGTKLVVGDAVLVQVEKAPYAQKLARLSGQLTLTSSALMWRPFAPKRLVISRKLTDQAAYRTCLESHCIPGALIVRTHAGKLTQGALLSQFEGLRMQFDAICSAFKYKKSQAPFLLQAVDALELLRQDDGPAPMRTDSLSGAIADAHDPNILLPSGGRLTFAHTQALCVVDVDTYQDTRQGAVHRANTEACHAIARALRLRQIGGIVVIDFINTPAQNALRSLLHDQTRGDPCNVKIGKFSTLGLLEMTRERRFCPIFGI